MYTVEQSEANTMVIKALANIFNLVLKFKRTPVQLGHSPGNCGCQSCLPEFGDQRKQGKLQTSMSHNGACFVDDMTPLVKQPCRALTQHWWDLV